MCEPTTIMLVGSLAMAAMSAASQVQAGNAAAKGHKEQAHQIETKRLDVRTSASQASRDRWQEFTDAEATNQVAIAMSGLSASSFDVSMRENQRRAGEDVNRIRMQADIEDSNLALAASDQRKQAKSARRQGIQGAAFTMGQAAFSAGMNMPGGSGAAKSISSLAKVK